MSTPTSAPGTPEETPPAHPSGYAPRPVPYRPTGHTPPGSGPRPGLVGAPTFAGAPAPSGTSAQVGVPGWGPGRPAGPVHPVGPPPRVGGRPGVGAAVAAAALGVLALVAIGVIGLFVGPAALPGASLLALLPLVGVMLALRWVDRWEREPWSALAVAFGWGASVSVLVALVLNTGATSLLQATGSNATVTSIFGAAVVAPVVEEAIKAAGVLIVFLVWRRSFDGPVDGLVYAGTVAAGFAFVENILYFGQTMAASGPAGGAAVATVFGLRAVMSPFAHLMFTACTGLALGIAARSRSRRTWVWAFPVGLLLAIVLHGLWNGSTFVDAGGGVGSGFVVLYVLFQVPLFVVAVVVAFWLRRNEARIVRERLTEYATGGWFAPAEVLMLASLRERGRAASWAGQRGGPAAKRAMRRFQVAATRLAYHRHRVLRQTGDPEARLEEAGLLAEVGGARAALVAALQR